MDGIINQTQVNENYEYHVEVVSDRRNGALNRDMLQKVLDRYSGEGWRLHSIFNNEVGKSVSTKEIEEISYEANATIDQTIMVFERKISEEV